jgi:hypothetical protein
MLPSAFTSIPKDVEVKAVPGVVPVTQADINLMNMADQEIDRSTVEPSPGGRMAARTAMIEQANAQLMIEPFSQQLAFFAASRSFHILTALFQYLPKSKLKKLSVPDQALDDGLTGTFEAIFKEPEDVLKSELDDNEVNDQMEKMKRMNLDVNETHVRRLMHSFKIHKDQEYSRKSGEPLDRVYISPSYLEDVKFYLFADAADGMQDKDAMAQAKFKEDLVLMLQDQTGSLVPKEVWREYIRMRGYNERILQKNQAGAQAPQGPQAGQQGAPGAQGVDGQPPVPTAAPGAFGQPPSQPNQIANAASIATGGGVMPRLAGV